MIRRSASTVLAATLAAGAAAADLSHLPAADAAPPEQRQRLVAADAAQAKGDLTQAYDLLRAARGDARLDPTLAVAIDRERDALASRVSEQLIADAHARQGEDHPALAEKLLTLALAYRSAAGDELRRLYADPAVVSAVGGTDAVRARLRALDDDESTAAGLRWHLAALRADAPLDQLDRQASRLALLRTLAGDADAEVVAWARLLAQAASARLAQPDGAVANETKVARSALAVASAVVGAQDADVVAGQARLTEAQRRQDLRAVGAREGAWSLRIGAWMPILHASFSASATPDSPSPGFAAQSASTSASGTGLGSRIDVGWLREPGPAGARSGYVWGGQLTLASATVDSDLVLADADTSASSLNGQKFKSHIGITAIGAQLVGGWRWALGTEQTWSVQARGLAGVASVKESYGTRRGVIEGGDSERTISKSAIEPVIGAEVALAWRPRPHWGASAALGVDALWLPSVSSDDHGSLFGSVTSTPGTYHESFGSAMAIGPYLLVGASYVY